MNYDADFFQAGSFINVTAFSSAKTEVIGVEVIGVVSRHSTIGVEACSKDVIYIRHGTGIKDRC